MADVQERVAQLEGRVEEHARMLTDTAGAVRHLEVRMDQRFTALERKLERKTDALEHKLDSHLRWMVGLYFATLIAIAASLVAG